MLRRMLATLMPVALSASILVACDSGTGPAVNRGSTRLTVQLTDAPADLAQAWVRIEKIVLLRNAADSLSGASAVTLTPDSVAWIDLLTLAGGAVQDLVTDTIPAGVYDQVRLYVCDMYVVTKDGQVIASAGAELPDSVEATGQLKLTSQCHSGFKVNLPFDSLALAGGAAQDLVLDFDAGRSFVHQAGKSGQWVVTPVLHAALQQQVASIQGTVALDAAITLPVACGGTSLTGPALLAGFVPTATKAPDTVRTGTTSGTGTYKITNVMPGTYTLGNGNFPFANGDTVFYTAAATPPTVDVVLGATATANYAVSAVTCKVKA